VDSKNEIHMRKNAAVILAVSWFQVEQAKAKSLGNTGVPQGTLLRTTTDAENENSSSNGSILSYTV
jgi:hypothetical protein